MAAQVLAEVSERIGRALVGKFNGANKAATTTTTAAVVAAADNNNNNDDSKAMVVDNLKMAQRMEIFPFFPSSYHYGSSCMLLRLLPSTISRDKNICLFLLAAVAAVYDLTAFAVAHGGCC